MSYLGNLQNKGKRLINMLGDDFAWRCEGEERVRSYLTPRRVLWKTEADNASVENENTLLNNTSGQIGFGAVKCCTLKNNGGKAGILLDFGIELNGGLQILINGLNRKVQNFKLRIRFGESAMEAMSELEGENNATNDHAVRDLKLEVSTLGMAEIGNTGFRFVRIDLENDNDYIEIESVRAIFVYKDIEYKGSFRCNDVLLNRIWNTGAYTVHLNMQNYLWDGIKRDRLVWIGDMHPEVSTIQAVFGFDSTVPRSLDFVRDTTRLPNWMNGIPSYSMWWIIIQYGWYMQNADIEYLKQQRQYLLGLLDQLDRYIGIDGRNTTPEMRFIDWPSSENKKAVEAGIQSLHILALEAGARLCEFIGEYLASQKCYESVEMLKRYSVDPNGSKQAAALMVLAGLTDAQSANKNVLAVGGAKCLSTFLGYYVLKARAAAGDINGCLSTIRDYWGGMLELGATTFWEDFNIEWMKNAARIDEIVSSDKKDVHGEYGDYCYKGYRHSLCHGWASGPTAWLSEYVLGIKIKEPGCRLVHIEPSLGDIQWVEGTYPTPMGIIGVRHERQQNGSIKSCIDAPKGIQVIAK